LKVFRCFPASPSLRSCGLFYYVDFSARSVEAPAYLCSHTAYHLPSCCFSHIAIRPLDEFYSSHKNNLLVLQMLKFVYLSLALWTCKKKKKKFPSPNVAKVWDKRLGLRVWNQIRESVLILEMVQGRNFGRFRYGL